MSYYSPTYRIYVHETDVAGVVHHSNYLRFFEMGRIEYLRKLNEPYLTFQKQGIGFVPIHIDISYLKPLRQDDEYQITTEIISLKHASFVLNQQIICNEKTMVEATIKLGCVSEPEFKPKKLPENLHKKLKKELIH